MKKKRLLIIGLSILGLLIALWVYGMQKRASFTAEDFALEKTRNAAASQQTATLKRIIDGIMTPEKTVYFE